IMKKPLDDHNSGSHRLRIAVAALALALLAIATTTEAQTFSVPYSFTGNTDGADPRAALIRDAAGNLYGTAAYGGAGGGTVFKLDSAGNYSVLRTFTGGPDGAEPFGALVMDATGTLFGPPEAAGPLG